jgi:hypothetical protein
LLEAGFGLLCLNHGRDSAAPLMFDLFSTKPKVPSRYKSAPAGRGIGHTELVSGAKPQPARGTSRSVRTDAPVNK